MIVNILEWTKDVCLCVWVRLSLCAASLASLAAKSSWWNYGHLWHFFPGKGCLAKGSCSNQHHSFKATFTGTCSLMRNSIHLQHLIEYWRNLWNRQTTQIWSPHMPQLKFEIREPLRHPTLLKFLQLMLRQTLQYLVQKRKTAKTVRGDGHCLLYAIRESLKAEPVTNIFSENLCTKLILEVGSHLDY